MHPPEWTFPGFSASARCPGTRGWFPQAPSHVPIPVNDHGDDGGRRGVFQSSSGVVAVVVDRPVDDAER
jgi:hypothetical protein